MSVIVAIKQDGVVYMGADTQTTFGNNRFQGLNEAGFKIRRLDNGILLGFCGRVAAKQSILANKDLFVLDENQNLTKQHIVNNIVPVLVDKVGYIGNQDSGKMDVCILLAYKDKMYTIEYDLRVVALNEIARTGAGCESVTYSLREQGYPVRERLLNALKTSARRVDSVSGPYVLIDTLNKQYYIGDMGEENY